MSPHALLLCSRATWLGNAVGACRGPATTCRHHVACPKHPASSSRSCAQVKSYLTGNPPIAIALNDGLVIGRREGGGAANFGYGRASDVVQLDDCNFHEVCAHLLSRR